MLLYSQIDPVHIEERMQSNIIDVHSLRWADCVLILIIT